MTIGERIRQQRESVDITQHELGRLCGVTKQTIYKYETGIITNIPMDKIALIAKALHVTPAYLMGWTQGSNIPTSPIHRIPILGRVAAGLPLYADEQIIGYTATTLDGGAEYFALRVQGDSMDALGIRSGDDVIVRKQDYADDGQVAVVLVDGEDATIKRIYRSGTTVTLMPQSTNPAHRPQIYDASRTQIRIIGVVVQSVITIV